MGARSPAREGGQSLIHVNRINLGGFIVLVQEPC